MGREGGGFETPHIYEVTEVKSMGFLLLLWILLSPFTLLTVYCCHHALGVLVAEYLTLYLPCGLVDCNSMFLLYLDLQR